MDFQLKLLEDQKLIEEALKACFAGSEPMAGLYEAMEYSLMAGGKRIRPVLTLEACRACGGQPEVALPFACAVEMIHTYSLIHDDLPCMDDDDLRRGKPSNHKVFGEATAILAGDALLTAAFETALKQSEGLSAERSAAAAFCLADAAGPRGMVGGQSLDLATEGHAVTRQELERLQRLKTGALLVACAEVGCIAAGGDKEKSTALRRYAQKVGLAFQVRDDMLDVEGNEQALGKHTGGDQAHDKFTFVTLLGMEDCRRLVETLTREAVEALGSFGPRARFLCWLAEMLAGRES